MAPSWSGVVALELALQRPELVVSLVLCEPAALSLAADDPAVREHVRRMSPAYEDGLTLEEFGRRFSAGWDKESDPGEWTEERRCEVDRIKRHQPPWEAGITVKEIRSLEVPTLVVSSSAFEFFEAIAKRMAGAAAVWQVIDGPPHRSQDTARFNIEVIKWWDAHDVR